MNNRSRNKNKETSQAPAYAAIDLGTNNCRLLVARKTAKGFRVVDSYSRIVRLGEGLHGDNRLNKQAMSRALEALKVCAAKIKKHNVQHVRSVATEACRRADNGNDFLTRVKDKTGLHLAPITSREEAELTLAGVAPLLSPKFKHALVFDIGGGSTEVMWSRYDRNLQVRLDDSLSLPMGVVTMVEKYGQDTVSPEVFSSIIADIDARLAPFDAKHQIAHQIAEGTVQMVGTSGTVTTVGGLYLGLERYERSKVDGLTMDVASIMAINRKLAAMDCETRQEHPCIGKDRGDLVVMGCAILEAVLRRWPVGRLRAADRGIREGLLLEMME